jgi:hypothetical protein
MFNLLRWWRDWRREEPFDLAYPDSTEDLMDCPDTQPTSPGALDSDPERLT